jgi:hypothetical protein
MDHDQIDEITLQDFRDAHNMARNILEKRNIDFSEQVAEVKGVLLGEAEKQGSLLKAVEIAKAEALAEAQVIVFLVKGAAYEIIKDEKNID